VKTLQAMGVKACSCLTAAPRFTYEKGAETILDLICDGRGEGGMELGPNLQLKKA